MRIWSRETGSAVPSRVSLFILLTRAEPGAYLRDSSRFPRRRTYTYLYRHTPSDQSRVYRVTHVIAYQWRSLPRVRRTGPVVLQVVPATGAAFAAHHGPINVRLSFPTPTTIIGMKYFRHIESTGGSYAYYLIQGLLSKLREHDGSLLLLLLLEWLYKGSRTVLP